MARVPSAPHRRRPWLSVAPLCVTLAAACHVDDAPAPTPAERAHKAVQRLDEANNRLDDELSSESSEVMADPVYTTLAKVQGTASFVVAKLPADGDIDTLVQIVLFEAAQEADELLRDALEEMDRLAGDKQAQRDALGDMRDATNDLTDALRDGYEALSDTDDGSGDDTTFDAWQAGQLLGQPGAVVAESSGDLTATFDCPQFPSVPAQIDLLDLVTGRSLETTTGNPPLQATTHLDAWTVVRATGTPVSGDVAASVVLPCTLELVYTPRPDLLRVAWTESRARALPPLLDDATQAVADARTAVQRGLDGATLSADEHAAYTALVSRYEARLSGLAAVAGEQGLTEQGRDHLDSVGDLSEETSLRLQLLMERRQKALSTLSNALKKVSDTQDAIVANLK